MTPHTHTHTHTVMQSSLHTYFSVHKLAENKGDRETMLKDTREIWSTTYRRQNKRPIFLKKYTSEVEGNGG